MKRTRFYSVLALVVILVALVASPAAYAASGAQAVVSTAALNVRQGPGTGYTVIDVVHAGDTLAVTGKNSASGWYQVSLAGGRTGWVSGSLVKIAGQAEIPEVAAPALQATAVTAPAARPQGGTIVFQISSGGTIYAANADGSNLRRLTTGMDPALSPDGQWVAFTRWDGVQNGITGSLWVIRIDGTGERQVMSGAYQPKSPSWSPDGKRVVIGMQQGGTVDDIYMCLVDGRMVESKTPIAGARCMPQRADPHWGLRVVDVASGSYEDVPAETHSFGPAWDPANAWHVVFRGDRGLESLDLNQKTTWVLSANPSYRGPVFSPDGSKIAVTFKQNDHWEVHVMNANGSGEVRLTETPLEAIIAAELQGLQAQSYNNAAPAWSPDGRQIAFISDRNGQYEIWAMNADGSNQHVLVTAAALQGGAIKYDGVDERVISWR